MIKTLSNTNTRAYLDKFKFRKLGATTETFEGLCYAYAGETYTIRYVDDTRELLEVREELRRDGAVVCSMAKEGSLLSW
jgi:hypothetical protein